MATTATQAWVNPDDLRKFARELGQFADHVTNYHSKLLSELNRLGDTFKDQDYVKFREHFQRSQMLLKKFVEAAKQTTPKLENDAKVVEESQRVRLEG